MRDYLERPWFAEVMQVHGSPGELDAISLDVVVNFNSGPREYARIKPLNYRRKAYTCVGPTPGDVCFVVWRGEIMEVVASFEPEFEECAEGGGGDGSVRGPGALGLTPSGKSAAPIPTPESEAPLGGGGGTS